MRVIDLVLLLFTLVSSGSIQNVRASPSYKMGHLLIHGGSGAFSLHPEPNYWNGNYQAYRRTPFFSAGFDYVLASTGAAYWGQGLYVSGAAGLKQLTGGKHEPKTLWSTYLTAIKMTHHGAYFVRRTIDVYSGYILGLRTHRYEARFSEGDTHKHTIKPRHQLALGISGTLRYSPVDWFSMYVEAAIGYNVDLLQVGLARKFNIQKQNRTKQ